MEFTGKVIAVMPVKSGVSAAGKEWAMQTYVLEDSVTGPWPRKIAVDAFGTEKIEAYNLQIGDTVTVEYDIDAKEYNGRWFNSVNLRAVRRGLQQDVAPVSAPQQAAEIVQKSAATPKGPSTDMFSDDLPF